MRSDLSFGVPCPRVSRSGGRGFGPPARAVGSLCGAAGAVACPIEKVPLLFLRIPERMLLKSRIPNGV